MVKHIVRAIGICVMAFGFAAPADAAFVTFSRISNNAGVDVAGQLSAKLTVVDNNLSFTFTNSSLIASSITDVYFEDTVHILTPPPSLTMSAGVSFSVGATPGHLPEGNVDPYNFNPNGPQFTADSTPPAAPNGINAADEWLTVSFQMTDIFVGSTVDYVASLINNGIRIGLHVQGIGLQKDSDSFLSNEIPEGSTAPVPEPASIALWLTMSVGGVFAARRKSKKVVC